MLCTLISIFHWGWHGPSWNHGSSWNPEEPEITWNSHSCFPLIEPHSLYITTGGNWGPRLPRYVPLGARIPNTCSKTLALTCPRGGDQLNQSPPRISHWLRRRRDGTRHNQVWERNKRTKACETWPLIFLAVPRAATFHARKGSSQPGTNNNQQTPAVSHRTPRSQTSELSNLKW